MKLLLSITIVFFTFILPSQSDTLWSVTRIKMYYDSTLFEIDSGRTVNGQKQGAWENYRYSTKGGNRKLVARLVFEKGKCLQLTYCSHSPSGFYSCQYDSLDYSGKYILSRSIMDGKVLWEKYILPESKLYTRYYFPSGELYGKGYEKTLILKGKGRCSSDIITSKKIGHWKYYKKNGKRRYFNLFDWE